MNNKIIIINGPNLNLLGEREQSQYGSLTFSELKENCLKKTAELKINAEFYQSTNNKELTINIQNRDAQYQKLELELGGFRAQRNDQDLELQEIKAELQTQFDASVITLENEALMRIAALEAKNQDLRSDIVEVGARQAMRGGDSTDLRVLYQTEYILKLAEIKLNFDRDVGSAIELLESAVSLLSTSGSETLLPIREALRKKHPRAGAATRTGARPCSYARRASARTSPRASAPSPADSSPAWGASAAAGSPRPRAR